MTHVCRIEAREDFDVDMTVPVRVLDAQMVQFLSQIETMYLVNLHFLEDLEDRIDQIWDAANTTIGDVFLDYVTQFRVYADYARNFDYAMDQCRESQELREYIKQCEKSPLCEGQSFSSFAILPIQRLPRYGLLLRNLLKETAADHPDHGPLAEALKGTGETIEYIESVMERNEASQDC